MVKYIENKDIMTELNDYDLILIGCNTLNKMGNGFQKRIALTYPEIEKIVKSTPYGDNRKLGSVKVIQGNPTFCVLFINQGRNRPDLNKDYLNYNALEKCLALINKNFPGKKIASTLIGASKFDGDGDKEKVIKIIERVCNDVDLFIYVDEQEDWAKKMSKEWLDTINYSITPKEIRKESMKEHYWHLFKGDITPMPDEVKKLSLQEVKKLLQQEKKG